MSWPVVSIGDIFDVARGGSPRPINDYITDDPDGLNWVMISDATASGKIITRTKKKIHKEGLKKTRQVKPGDFILSNSMSFGRPYIMGIEGCIHDGWLLLRSRSTQIDSNYFYHLLGSSGVYQKLASRAAGATVKNLNSDIVRELEIPLPPLDEQKRIAAILDQADALRRLRQRALDKLNSLGQSIFYEMFVAGHSESWTPTSVERVVLNTRTGPFGSQLLHSEFVDEGIAVLGIDNVVSNTFLWAKPRFITPEKYDRLKRYTVQPGDVLITIMGTCGRCAVVPKDVPVAINTKHICCLTTDQGKVLPEFLKTAFLMHPSVLRQLGVEAKGAVMPGLNMGIIKSLTLPLPPLALQKEYVDRLMELELQLEREKQASLKSGNLFLSLQQRAFRGEL